MSLGAGDDDASDLVALNATEAPPAEAAAPPEGPSAARSALVVTAGILLSKVFGLFRQQIVLHYFGLTGLADVLNAGFRIGNVVQNLMGEGTLSASFIPIYAKARAGGRSEAATRFALTALGFLLVTVGAATAGAVVFSPILARVLASGFDAERVEMTGRLLPILFPMTGLLVLSAWGLGVLNAHRRFFLSYAAPVLWNLAQIAALLVFGAWLGQRGEPLLTILCWSALVGAALQIAVLLPAARALLGSLRPHLDKQNPELRAAVALLPHVLLGKGVIQLSSVIDMELVSYLGTGALTAMQAAMTVYLLPISLLGTGEAAAALPEMAGDTLEENAERRNATIRARLGASLSRVTVLTVPTTLALALLGGEIIRVLYRSGKFDDDATATVRSVLFAYAFALLGNASARVLTTTSWAIGDTKTPMRYAIYRVVVSTVGSLVLMQWLGVVGVVLGAVLAAWVETVALGWKLRGQIGGLGLDKIPFARTAALGAICIAPALALAMLLPPAFEQSRAGSMLVLVVFAAAFAVAAPRLGLIRLGSLLKRKR